MTIEEIQYEAQGIMQEWGSNDSAPYVEFVEKLASMELPEPPSNLDEAAEEWCKSNNKGIALCADKKSHYLADGTEAFKAGAKWMAEQFQKIEGELVDWYETKGVDYCCGIKTDESFEIPEGFYIRKKQ